MNLNINPEQSAYGYPSADKYEAWYHTPKGRFADTLEKKVISKLCEIHNGDKVLEIGCGTGHFSAYFKELGAQVTGLDKATDMLQVAKARYGDLNINFKEGDAYRLPFADNSFDIVAMITFLEFIPDPKRVLHEAFRVSRGRIFLGILNRLSFLAWNRKRSGKKIWQEAHFYTLKEVLKLLGEDKKVKWKSVLHFPLVNINLLFNARLNLENWLSELNLPFGAFIGILIET